MNTPSRLIREKSSSATLLGHCVPKAHTLVWAVDAKPKIVDKITVKSASQVASIGQLHVELCLGPTGAYWADSLASDV